MRKTYAHHRPSSETVDKVRELRKAFDTLHDAIDKVCPNSTREKACALTNLETTAMWAIKALVCNAPDSVVETL